MKILALAVLLQAACAHAQPQPSSVARPALYARHARPASGWDAATLAEDLDNTQQNLTALLDLLEPWDGSDPAAGKDAEWAQKKLLDESAACDELIKSGDELLARGIPREKPKGKAAFVSFFAARGTVVYKDPTIEKSRRQVAAAQVNVAGHMASLIRSRASDAKGWAEREAKIEDWLAKSRLSLERSRKQLASATP